ncbi:hypothetical protein Efla_006404 [Eimeria flavescens]
MLESVDHAASLPGPSKEEADPRRSWRYSALPPATLTLDAPRAPPASVWLSLSCQNPQDSAPLPNSRRPSDVLPAFHRPSGSRLVPLPQSVGGRSRLAPLADLRELPQPPQRVLQRVVVFEPETTKAVGDGNRGSFSLPPDSTRWRRLSRAAVEEEASKQLTPLPPPPPVAAREEKEKEVAGMLEPRAGSSEAASPDSQIDD